MEKWNVLTSSKDGLNNETHLKPQVHDVPLDMGRRLYQRAIFSRRERPWLAESVLTVPQLAHHPVW